MRQISRSVLIVKPKQLFLDWVNSTAETPEHRVTMEEVRREYATYLIREYTVIDEPHHVTSKHFRKIFNNQLNGWHAVKADWPKNRTHKMFQEWFEVEIHSEVFDLEDSEIIEVNT